jgi:hypothetical protein
VANLASFSPSITHRLFVNAVSQAFRAKYYPEDHANDLVEVKSGNEVVEIGVEELRASILLVSIVSRLTIDTYAQELGLALWSDARIHA